MKISCIDKAIKYLRKSGARVIIDTCGTGYYACSTAMVNYIIGERLLRPSTSGALLYPSTDIANHARYCAKRVLGALQIETSEAYGKISIKENKSRIIFEHLRPAGNKHTMHAEFLSTMVICGYTDMKQKDIDAWMESYVPMICAPKQSSLVIIGDSTSGSDSFNSLIRSKKFKVFKLE